MSRSRAYRPTIGFVLAGATLLAQSSQLDSLKTLARAQGGTAVGKITVEPPLQTLSDVVSGSQLILRARLGGMVTRLSDDESTVFREFLMTPLAMFKQPSDYARASMPGGTDPATLRVLGGSMIVDELRLKTVTNMEDPETPYAIGGEYFLFLRKAGTTSSTTVAPSPGVYELTSSHFSVYPVQNGRIVAFTRWFANRVPHYSRDPAQFAAEITRER